MTKLTDAVRRARSRATPLIGITTQDWRATAQELAALEVAGEREPAVLWDVVSGVAPLNEEGQEFLGLFMEENEDVTVQNPVELLLRLSKVDKPLMCLMVLPSDTVFEDGPNAVPFMQAVANLRDDLKQVRASLVLLGPSLTLPPFLRQDMVVFDDPLPDRAALKEIIEAVVSKANGQIETPPDDEAISRAVDLTLGLSAFMAEQSVYMALGKKGLDLEMLAENQRSLIAKTPGLSIISGSETTADVKGCDALVDYNTRILKGRVPIRAIVVFDEIEKMLAGATGGDLSGVSSDALGLWLREMQDKKYLAELLLGPPGTGKTFVAQTLGNTFRIPTILFDMGGMKGSGLVGQAEKEARQGWKVLEAISGGNALVVATCNSVATLPPEVRRRFNLGTFFVDLPSQEGLSALWDHYKAKYGLDDQETPAGCDGWTGAEVHNACRIAWVTGMTLEESAARVTPIIQTMPEQINRLRSEASGRYQSADRVGVYRMPVTAKGLASKARQAVI